MTWLLILTAGAQTSPAVSGQLFRPSVDSQKTWWTDDSHRSRNGYVLARGVLHYANKPVVYQNADGELVNVVSDVMQLSILGGYTAGPVRIGLDVPVYLQSAGIEGREAGLGDVHVDLKATLLDPEEKAFGFALAGRLGLPTTTVNAALGNRGFGWEISAIADKSIDKVLLAANVGTRGIPGADLENFRWDDQFQARAGIGYGRSEGSGVSLDVGSNINYASVRATPVEAIAGAWTRVADVRLRGGVGTGLTTAFGAPVYRLLAGVSYEPPQFADSDKDGIANDKDACRDDAEDLDRFEDGDGCPEATHVRVELQDVTGAPIAGTWRLAQKSGQGGDTAMLAAGQYELMAEAPGYAAKTASVSVPDGKPYTVKLRLEAVSSRLAVRVVDADGNVIPDATWTVPGDRSVRAAGAPVDVRHGAVSVKAEAPGFRSQTGTVEVRVGGEESITIVLEPSKISLSGDRIDLSESVYFETGNAVIKSESYSLLDDVALILRDHPELSKVRIEGHTDSRGSAAYNLQLSTERAQSVRAYLVERGVGAGRLQAQGFGETQPIDATENQAAWTKNRRVDFFVAERSD